MGKLVELSKAKIKEGRREPRTQKELLVRAGGGRSGAGGIMACSCASGIVACRSADAAGMCALVPLLGWHVVLSTLQQHALPLPAGLPDLH